MFVNVYMREMILRLIFDFFFLFFLHVQNSILGTQLGEIPSSVFVTINKI